MIGTFPAFTTLDIGHRAEVEAITSKFAPYADFSFVNLYAWSMNQQTEVSLLNGNLVVRLPDYITGDTLMYSIIGRHRVEQSLRQIMELSGSLCLVPEEVARHLDDPAYLVQDDRDNADYMYEVFSLATLQGKELKKKRNKVHRFLRDFGEAVKVSTETDISETTAHALREVFKEWAASSNKSDEECHAEYVAIDRMLQHAKELNLLFAMVKIEEKIVAFSVHELRDDGHAICHFEKALPVHECLYAFTIYYTANELAARGVQQVNWQQDLGIPGLRQAKTSYQPNGLLKKFSITRA
ncbi:MAG TPA: phosphatidylglycerol lysyltransferase domain-containing protein [Candidatus Saccharimonadales bacterium]|nr:phosphatidylglycerol lysyltransferase domain-containing protein [Candidatus Saccharimonadales bacterium]